MSVKIEAISEHALEIGEGPHWGARRQALYFVGLTENTIHKYSAATGHTQTTLNARGSFIIPVEGRLNQFVVGMGRDVAVVQWDGTEGSTARVVKTLASADAHAAVNTTFNDGKADPRGRLYAANLTYIFDFEKHDIQGLPDGMTIDTDGNLWVAVFGASGVYQISPSGELLRSVPLPVPQVTSCTFGGPDLDILFVTSGSLDTGSGRLKPPSGFTFKITGLGVKGHPNVNFKL